MLTAYKHSTNNDIVETTLDHSASWINVVEPDREEIEQLIETYNLPEDFIRDPLDAMRAHVLSMMMTQAIPYHYRLTNCKLYAPSCLIIRYNPIRYCYRKRTYFNYLRCENEFLENYARQDDVNLNFHSRFALDILLTISNHYNRNLRLLNKSRIRIERELKIILLINFTN